MPPASGERSRDTGGYRHAPLAEEWRALRRAATVVALLTSPAFFLLLWQRNGWALPWALLGTFVAVVAFRGLVDVITRRLIPWPNLYNANPELLEEDVIARRRAWYWRKKFRRLTIFGTIFVIVVGTVALISGESFGGAISEIGDAIKSAAPLLLVLGFQLPLFFVFNFLIFFGPLLIFGVKQMKGYEPGDADWGVRLDDVRGQKEAKEEVRRVISLWQSGDAFERAGGKRERGLLFLGAPGTGKTMLSKAIATGFNCPFVTMPGSGFAQMLMGLDVVIVMLLVRKAKKLAAKWGGQCIVFIDEIDAVGMRRQALRAATRARPRPRRARSTTTASSGRTARSPPPATSSSRRAPGATGSSPQRAGDPGVAMPGRVQAARPDRERRDPRRHVRRRPGPGAQPAARADGRHRRPAADAALLHQPHQHVPGRALLRPPEDRQREAAPAQAEALAAPDLLHRRHQRADQRARPGAHPPGPHGPPHLVPHAHARGPPRHLRALHGEGRPRSRARHATSAATSWPASRAATRRR